MTRSRIRPLKAFLGDYRGLVHRVIPLDLLGPGRLSLLITGIGRAIIGFMPTVPAGFVHQAQLSDQIAKVVRKLGKSVVRVKYSLGVDSSGEPSIFFRIVLTDSASREDKLAQVTGRVATILFDELRPHENWGLLPYFSFRSKSEQEARNDPEWA